MNQRARRQHGELLGVGPDASADDINAAFRKLSKDAHPDAGGSREAFDQLLEARASLLDALGDDGEPKVYLSSTGAPMGRSRPAPAKRPVWVPGAMLALLIGGVAGVVGAVQVDRQLIVIGLITAAAVFVVVTTIGIIRRVHARNTTLDATYRSPEDVVRLRNR